MYSHKSFCQAYASILILIHSSDRYNIPRILLKSNGYIQLNMYCFKKYRTKAHSDSMSYWHPFFVRGKKELLCNVIRKNPRRILKQKEAQLKGLGIESRSSYSTSSREQEYEESKRTISTSSTSKQESVLQINSDNSDSNNVYNCMMQFM